MCLILTVVMGDSKKVLVRLNDCKSARHLVVSQQLSRRRPSLTHFVPLAFAFFHFFRPFRSVSSFILLVFRSFNSFNLSFLLAKGNFDLQCKSTRPNVELNGCKSTLSRLLSQSYLSILKTNCEKEILL